MSVRLPDHLDLIASAPDGIKKLRGLIFELAVRGKLVPQDPNDEPASELLGHIAKKREQLEAEGVCKKSKPVTPVGEDEQTFVGPSGWVWCRLQSAFDVRDGTHDSPRFYSTGIPFLTSKNIYGGKLDLLDVKYVSEEDHVGFSKRSRVDRDDILFAMIGSIGNPVIVNTDLEFSFKNMAVFKYYSKALASPKYLQIFLSVVAHEMKAKAAGGVQSFVALGTIRNQPIALPPLAEQHRIVAKVNELMALCDRLESEQTDSEAAHARLVETLLGTLTQSADADELGANWQLLAGHFDTLFATDASLNALKQTILQLAVMGKLVPQNSDDEPASELLKRIGQERVKLETEGVCKKSKPTPLVDNDEQAFLLPSGWEWIRLGQIGYWGAGATPLRSNPHYYGGTIPWFKSGELTSDFITESEEHVTELALKKCSLRQNKVGDVLIAMYGATIGKAAILAIAATTNQAVCACTPNTGVFNRYLLLLLKALKSNFIEQGAGGAQPNISREKIIATVTALPPEPEQHRIVAKVDELMALCDRLKADLAESRGVQEQLAATLIESALAA